MLPDRRSAQLGVSDLSEVAKPQSPVEPMEGGFSTDWAEGATAPHKDSYGRLRKRAEFLAVRRGEKRRGRLFLLEVLDRGDAGEPRVGFTVTKKAGNAVTRNRIRRRLKEAIRTQAARDMAAGSDYVIVGRREVIDAPFGVLKAELSRRMSGKTSNG